MATQVAFTIDWSVWIPIGIAALSLALSFWQVRRQSSKSSLREVEKKVDDALAALKECEENLRHLGRENDALRREKFALLEQIARMAGDKLDITAMETDKDD